MIVRDANVADLEAIREIYNAFIPTTTIAWSEQLQTPAEREAWFARQTERGHAVLVAEDDGEVVGFAAYADFRGAGVWPGYRFTVEHTIHVRDVAWGRGVGRQLLEALIDRAHGDGIHVMVGAVDSDNVESLRFHERLGFVEVGRMPEIGTKFGRWLDLVLVQRVLDDGPPRSDTRE